MLKGFVVFVIVTVVAISFVGNKVKASAEAQINAHNAQIEAIVGK